MASVESVERVYLDAEPERWEKYPPDLQKQIIEGGERLERLRLQILGRARVSELPPVQVVDIGWIAPPAMTPRGRIVVVHGYSTIFRTEAGTELGARVSAPAVIHCSDEALTGILLHEFCHSFFHAREIIRARTDGRLYAFNADQARVYDAEYDKSCLDPPQLWFSYEDVKIFPYHHDTLLNEAAALIAREWVAKGLPTEVPGVVAVGSEVQIPGAIARHIRATM